MHEHIIELTGNISTQEIYSDKWKRYESTPSRTNRWRISWSCHKETDGWYIDLSGTAVNTSQYSTAYGGIYAYLSTSGFDDKDKTLILERAYGSGCHWYPDSHSNAKQRTTKSVSYRIGELTEGTIYLYVIGQNAASDAERSACLKATINLCEHISAPTFLGVEALVSGSADLKVSWSPAQVAKNNPFEYYLLEGTIGDKQISAPWESTTYTIDGADLEKIRGQSVTLSISACGGNDSEIPGQRKSSQVSFKVNTLPILTQVSLAQTIFPSTSQSYSTKATFSASDIDEQPITYYYAKTNGAKEQVLNNTVTISESGAIRFYAYDGLEYSEPKEVAVTKGTQPNFEINTQCNSLDSINKKSEYFYTTYLKLSLSPVGGQSNSTYSYKIKYKEDNGASGWKEVGQGPTEKGPQLEIADIRSYIAPSANYGYYYKIEITRNDGIESYSRESDTYYLTKIPNITLDRQLQQGYHTVSNVTYTHFDTFLQLKIDRDDGYKELKINVTGDAEGSFNKVEIATLTSSHLQGNYYLYKPSFKPQSTGSYKTGTIVCAFAGYETGKLTSNIAQISRINLFNFMCVSNDNYKPFTGSGANFSFGTTDSLYSSPAVFGFYSEPTYSLIISGNGNISRVDGLKRGGGSGNNTVQFSRNGQDLYNQLDELKYDKDRSGYQPEFYVQYVNAYGGASNSNSYKLTIDYTEGAENNGTDVISQNGNDIISLSNWAYLKEGVAFNKVNLSIKSYNALEGISIYYNYNNNTYTLCNIPGSSFVKSGKPGYKNPSIYSISHGFSYIIPSLVKDEEVTFYLKISSAVKQDVDIISRPFKRHVAPVTSFDTLEYDSGESSIAYKISINDLGVDGALKTDVGKTWYLLKQNGGQVAIYPDTEGEGTYSHKVENDFESFAPKLVTTFSAKYSINGVTKSAFTTNKTQIALLYKMVYNLLPTVSYRQNHLGINTSTPSAKTDSVVYINAYGDRKKLYFVFGEEERYLDLTSGEISGFQINCGSWD